MKVLLEAPILTKSGYGEHSRLVFKAISQNDNLTIFVNPLNWGTCTWDTPEEALSHCINRFRAYHQHCESNKQKQEYDMQIHVGIPSEFTKKAPYSICVTAGIETDRVSPNWIFKTHQGIDKLIVPSEHAKAGFVNTGYQILNNTNNSKTELLCNCPVDVVPYPVKHPPLDILEIDFKTNFNFLQISMMGERKDIETSIRCFVEQFRNNEDVGLVLKTSSSKSTVMDRQNTKREIENYINLLGDKKCKVYLIHGNLTEGEIHSLYMHPKIKAYYTTTHGEGYGLPLFEAAYSGLPVIATNWSGHLDFLTPKQGKNKKLFAKIDYELKKVSPTAVWKDLITEESRWAYVKANSVKKQLENVYKNHGMYKKWAKILKQDILENYKLEEILARYNEIIFSQNHEQTEKEEEVLIL